MEETADPLAVSVEDPMSIADHVATVAAIQAADDHSAAVAAAVAAQERVLHQAGNPHDLDVEDVVAVASQHQQVVQQVIHHETNPHDIDVVVAATPSDLANEQATLDKDIAEATAAAIASVNEVDVATNAAVLAAAAAASTLGTATSLVADPVAAMDVGDPNTVAIIDPDKDDVTKKNEQRRKRYREKALEEEIKVTAAFCQTVNMMQPKRVKPAESVLLTHGDQLAARRLKDRVSTFLFIFMW